MAKDQRKWLSTWVKGVFVAPLVGLAFLTASLFVWRLLYDGAAAFRHDGYLFFVLYGAGFAYASMIFIGLPSSLILCRFRIKSPYLYLSIGWITGFVIPYFLRFYMLLCHYFDKCGGMILNLKRDPILDMLPFAIFLSVGGVISAAVFWYIAIRATDEAVEQTE